MRVVVSATFWEGHLDKTFPDSNLEATDRENLHFPTLSWNSSNATKSYRGIRLESRERISTVYSWTLAKLTEPCTREEKIQLKND